MPAAWLSADAPSGDVVLSSRSRSLRNLVGHRFPHQADRMELEEIMTKVLDANRASPLRMEVFRAMTAAERDYFVVSRICSHDFQWGAPGRALLVDSRCAVSLMVNEEDHLRLQALTAGWSIQGAESLHNEMLEELSLHLKFSFVNKWGYLAASPFNTGLARRYSAMFHLIGLAQARKLPDVMNALGSRRVVVRGLFGESSRAVGAFVQVSVTGGTRADFIGACEYLIEQERYARANQAGTVVPQKCAEAVTFAEAAQTMSLADSLRVLAWLRWGVLEGFFGNVSYRKVDAAIAQLDLMTGFDPKQAEVERADWMRQLLTSLRAI